MLSVLGTIIGAALTVLAYANLSITLQTANAISTLSLGGLSFQGTHMLYHSLDV